VPLAELEERQVYYEEHGDGEPVLLINGLGADHTTWGLQTAFLSKHFRVIVFDNPGIGQTEGPRGPYTSALFADVAAGLLRFLGFERAHIVGASMGGLIAQQLAVRHAELVRSLTLHCSWWRADRRTTALIRSWQSYARVATPLDLARQIWLWVLTPRFFEECADEIAELEREVESNPNPQSAEAFSDQAEACIGHEALEEIASVEAPTLITVGDGDILTPPSHSFEIKARMPKATLHVWPEMGHAPFWEIPDQFNELTYGFLREH
jgi:pimeloyl-ACP methyl ester carboxylesterase